MRCLVRHLFLNIDQLNHRYSYSHHIHPPISSLYRILLAFLPHAMLLSQLTRFSYAIFYFISQAIAVKNPLRSDLTKYFFYSVFFTNHLPYSMLWLISYPLYLAGILLALFVTPLLTFFSSWEHPSLDFFIILLFELRLGVVFADQYHLIC